MYVYDFGDDWRHEVVVETSTLGALDQRAPAALIGERGSMSSQCLPSHYPAGR